MRHRNDVPERVRASSVGRAGDFGELTDRMLLGWSSNTRRSPAWPRRPRRATCRQRYPRRTATDEVRMSELSRRRASGPARWQRDAEALHDPGSGVSPRRGGTSPAIGITQLLDDAPVEPGPETEQIVEIPLRNRS